MCSAEGGKRPVSLPACVSGPPHKTGVGGRPMWAAEGQVDDSLSAQGREENVVGLGLVLAGCLAGWLAGPGNKAYLFVGRWGRGAWCRLRSRYILI